MSESTRVYAALSQAVYHNKSTVSVNGVEYALVDSYQDPSGFYGAIYQEPTTHELIVAFRGTQFTDDKVRDLFQTDGQIGVCQHSCQIKLFSSLTKYRLDRIQCH